jgi:D-arabinose 1-dehydrogenase-like Zn-dependent alcohol dehydrogenase
VSQLKAAFYEGNQTIRIGECTPIPPGPSEVQIQISYCGICGTDLHAFHGAMDHRVHIPHVLGHEMSGTIATLGSKIEGFAPGDPLWGTTFTLCVNPHTPKYFPHPA